MPIARPFLLAGLVLSLGASEVSQVRLDDAGRHPFEVGTGYVIGPRGATLVAGSPLTCANPIRLERSGDGGLTATFLNVSLRGVTEDDWRTRPEVTGTRQDPIVAVGGAAGTPEERARFRIGGNDRDWDNVSIQWDGVLAIPSGGIDLATASDDGSRVWIDTDLDGVLSAKEWGSNGWGGGQGVTTRIVHQALPAGLYTIRVQFEEGGGGNACSLLWRGPDTGATDTWVRIPASAFLPYARLRIEGPATLAGPVTGGGVLDCGSGVHLAGPLALSTLAISGRVTLDADLDLAQAHLRLDAEAVLDCAGHSLAVGAVSGAGRILLSGGRLASRGAVLPVILEGPGSFAPGAPITSVTAFDHRIRIDSDTYILREPSRTLASIPLAAPLTTVLPVALATADGTRLTVRLDIPADAPADLGLGAWRADEDGRWFQAVHPRRLTAGTHTITFDLGGDQALWAEGHRGTWSSAMAAENARVGLFLFASTPSSCRIVLDAALDRTTVGEAEVRRLTDLALDGWDGHLAHGATGQRWELQVRPDPYPADPFDPAVFRLDLVVSEPDGSERRLAGFHDQPVRREDRGDRELFLLDGQPHFSVRFRPRLPGVHRLRLHHAWNNGETHTVDLGELNVDGAPWDAYARPDADDPRFFSADGRFVWPLGHNLHSTYDVRAVPAVGSAPTVDRGSFTREALLERLAAHGGTGCETWLSAWNLGLEWIPQWAGYHGAGRYHAGHAWALDHFLDLAEARGMRINLSIFNHGMARDGDGAEMEWPFHPYRKSNGGWLESPSQLFTDPEAFRHQTRLFRYLTARYADSPALLGWKLWAEVNLANAPREAVVAWHASASEALARMDPYRRAVTTHWCGDWNNADAAIAVLPHIGYLTIDAYHGDGTAIAALLCESTKDPTRPNQGLAGYGKPVLVTEFGGSAFACPPPRLAAEHAIGPWAGFVCGHAGSPMLWWFEWIDQGDRYGVYAALGRFIAGEDLRGASGGVVAPTAKAEDQGLWCRAWRKPDGRHLGYVLDAAWSRIGGEGRAWNAGTLTLADLPAGTLEIEWWDADRGDVTGRQQVTHQGGPATLPLPAFRGHQAFKVWRVAAGAEPTAGR